MVGKIQRVNLRERCLRQRGLFLTGIARRRTESISWKIAVLAPKPSVRVRTETMVKPGLRRRRRKAWPRSCPEEGHLNPLDA